MTAEAAKSLADAGPWAVVLFLGGMVGLIGARMIVVLWRNHLESDGEDRRQRDENFLLARDAVDGVRRLAAAQESRERRAERKNRPGDP